jgi:tRNA pseudouridine13 synthase
MNSHLGDINLNYQYAYGKPSSSAIIKQNPDDFIVKELLSFEPQGSGTHAFLYIEKKSLNTVDVIKLLAEFVGIEAKHIGYAGLKDKHAITSQWFSINLEGISEPDWELFSYPDVVIKIMTYHTKKLKIGSIASNQFGIVLRNISPCNHKDIEHRLDKIIQYGAPNYFGPQRFGINNQNISKAASWFAGKIKVKQRSQKSILISAARSLLFNQLLSSRIEKYGWNQLISGEVMMLHGSRSIFVIEQQADEETCLRFETKDIHPTLSLWGQGRLISASELAELENTLLEDFASWCQALENKGLKKERRALRVIAENLQYNWLEDDQLQLQFSLPKGCYATSVLREIVIT